MSNWFIDSVSTTLDKEEYINFNDLNITEVCGWRLLEDEEEKEPIHPYVAIGNKFRIDEIDLELTIYKILDEYVVLSYENEDVKHFLTISIKEANELIETSLEITIDKKSEKQNLNVPIGTKFKVDLTLLIGEIISFIETTNSVVVDWGETSNPQFQLFPVHIVNYNFNYKIWEKI